MERAGRSVIHMEVGEPDFATADEVIKAAVQALAAAHTKYSQALGIPELRQAIARTYPLAVRPEWSRVMVTPGSSGALQLIFGVIVNPGDEVLMADPGYPCNRHFVRMYEGCAKMIPVEARTNYQLTSDLVRRNWSDRTVAVMLASPANPTGTVVRECEMGRIVATVHQLGGVLIVDEIYHGLTYGFDPKTALSFSPDVFVVNSFSKYYCMTGWRMGWLVSPTAYVESINRLAQNVFISASTPAQYACLAAFEPAVREEMERRRGVFGTRRDYLVPALRELGFKIPIVPQGAFYVYADCSDLTDDSYAFAMDILDKTGVAITPGIDFGSHRAKEHVRFSYANDLKYLQEGVRRISRYLVAPKSSHR